MPDSTSQWGNQQTGRLIGVLRNKRLRHWKQRQNQRPSCHDHDVSSRSFFLVGKPNPERIKTCQFFLVVVNVDPLNSHEKADVDDEHDL